MSIYTENGYKDREDYLRSLADEHNLDYKSVSLFAELLGPDQDFDALICALERNEPEL